MEIITLGEMRERLLSMSDEEKNDFFIGFSGLWCKFYYTAHLNVGLPRAVVLAHGPRGCTSNVDTFFSPYYAHSWGSPTHSPKCSTNLTESDVILGAEEKLKEAILEIDRRLNPELIIVVTCCASGIIGEDVDGVMEEVKDMVKAKIYYQKSEGFRYTKMGSQMEEMLVTFVDLMDEPKKKIKDSVNLLGIFKDPYVPSGYRFPTDITEYSRYIEALGLHINSIIFDTYQGIKSLQRAPEAQYNVCSCITWALPMAKEMKKRFGIDYSPHGQALGVEINRKWIMTLARFFHREEEAEKFWEGEYKKIEGDFKRAQDLVHGRIALVDGGRGTQGSVARSLMHARFALELGMEPVVYNVHPLEAEGKYWDVDYFLSEGLNPKIVWHPYSFSSGINPLTLMEHLKVGPENVFYIHADVFHYSTAVGEPFSATGAFDSSIIPKVTSSSHVRRCRRGPHRTYGLSGTHVILQEIINAVKALRKGIYPTFEARMNARG